MIGEARKAVGFAVKPVGRSDALYFIGVDRAKAANRREHRIEDGQKLRAFPPPGATRQAHSGLFLCYETALFRHSCLNVLRSHKHYKWHRSRPVTRRALFHERCSRWIIIAILQFGWAQNLDGCCLHYLMPKLECIQLWTPTQARVQARGHFDAVCPITNPMTHRLKPTLTRRRIAL